MVDTTAVLVVARIPGAERAVGGQAAIDEGIRARLVDGRRGRSRHTAGVRVGTLRVVFFAIFITSGHRNRAGPQFDRRTIDGKAEGFLTLGHDRRRSEGGAARAVQVVEVGDLTGGQVAATEGVEGHATILLRDGVAADDVALAVDDRILRQVEAREGSVLRASTTGSGCAGAADQRRARQRHVVDLDRGAVFAVLEVRVPAPGLTEQVEGAIAAHDVTTLGAQQEHLLAGRDVAPVAGILDRVGRVEAQAVGLGLGTNGSVCREGRLAPGRVGVEQAGGRQIGTVATQHHAGLGRVALGRSVLGTADAIVQGGVDFRGRRQVIRQAHVDVAAGDRIDQALGELAGAVLVTRILRRADAGVVDGVDQGTSRIGIACAGEVEGPRPTRGVESLEPLRAVGDAAIGKALRALGDAVVAGARLAGGGGGVGAVGSLAGDAAQVAATDVDRVGCMLLGLREARQQAVAVGVFRGNREVRAAAHEGGTGSHLHQGLAHVAIGRQAGRGIHLEAFELLVGHEVDHARDRVRTPGGRGAAGHNVNALDQHLRHLRNVDGAVEVTADDALAVQEDQGTQRRQAAQAERGQADQAGGGRAGVVADAGRALQGGQFGNGVEDVGLGRSFEVGGAHNRGRGRGVKAGGLKAAGGHNNRFDAFLRHGGTGAQRQNGRAARKTRTCLRQTVIHRIFPLDVFLPA